MKKKNEGKQFLQEEWQERQRSKLCFKYGGRGGRDPSCPLKHLHLLEDENGMRMVGRMLKKGVLKMTPMRNKKPGIRNKCTINQTHARILHLQL